MPKLKTVKLKVREVREFETMIPITAYNESDRSVEAISQIEKGNATDCIEYFENDQTTSEITVEVSIV